MIELIVTLVVFGVMLSLAAPAMAGMINRGATQSAVNQLTGDVAYARMLAVRNQQRANLNLTSTGYTITVTTPAGGVRTAKTVNLAQEYPGMTVTLPTGVPSVEFSFNSRGLLNMDGDREIQLSRRGRTETVFVSALGRAYRDY